MERHATKILLCVTFALVAWGANGQAKWMPEFQLPLAGETAASSKDLTISEYLAKGVPFSAKESECTVELSIFSFRVNSGGIVDSIYVEGNLDRDAVDVIKKNIRSTSNKWKIPKTTSPRSECWFVYPYFDAGKSSGCSKTALTYRNQLIQLVRMYSESKPTADRFGRVILPPNEVMLLSNK